MKAKIIRVLKVAVPLLLGIYICWYFWNSFTQAEKESFAQVFLESNYLILFSSLVIGFVSHLSRAIRWKIMLKAMGYSPTLKNTYNAIMIGYIANLVLPRVGEAVRAGTIRGTDNIPFEKGFGTIVAERIIDLVCLAIVTGIAIGMNYETIVQLMDIIKDIATPDPTKQAGVPWLKYTIIGVFTGGAIAVVVLYFKHEKFNAKIKTMIKGFIDGLKTIFTLKNRLGYLFHTALIWCCYIAMFWVTFYAWEGTANLPPYAIMSTFVLGTIGFILVQGGIGTYQLLMATALTFFIAPDFLIENKKFLPEHFGFANLVWLTQTVLILVLGLVSLGIVQKAKKESNTA